MKCSYILTGVTENFETTVEAKSSFVVQSNNLHEYKPYFARLSFDLQSSDPGSS